MGAMLTVEEAQRRILALAPQMPEQEVLAEAAIGRYLAQDLLARRTQPSADLSAMDGYAIGGEGPGPWHLVGESRAGAPFARALKGRETVRISTGAHLPEGADRVLIQENAAVNRAKVECIGDFPETGRHVRQRGFDFAQGECVLKAGSRITPASLALAISAGHSRLCVRRAPSVAVLDSGDELVAAAEDCAPHQIPASNGAMIGAMLAGLGCTVNRLGPVPDDREALQAALARAESADIVVTTGGASVGDHDLMRPALEQWGAQLGFWKVAMKPGKPVMLATREAGHSRQVVFGLPGNPVSSYVTCLLFVLPLVRAAMGASSPLPRRYHLPLASAVPAVGKRREFLRAHWDGKGIAPLGSQDSSGLAALAGANCLIERPEGSGRTEAGTSVPCLWLENGGFA